MAKAAPGMRCSATLFATYLSTFSIWFVASPVCAWVATQETSKAAKNDRIGMKRGEMDFRYRTSCADFMWGLSDSPGSVGSSARTMHYRPKSGAETGFSVALGNPHA